MRKRLLILFPLVGLFLLIYGNGFVSHVVAKSLQEEKMGCEDIDNKMREEIKNVAEILIQDEHKVLTNRINELSLSDDALEAEKSLVEEAVCVDMINEKMELRAKMNTYHSLLAYIIKTLEEEDVQFEQIEIKSDEMEDFVQLEGIWKNSEKKVQIDHYYSKFSSAYLAHRNRLNEEELKQIEDGPSPFVNAITNGLSASSYQIIQNPIEKFMVMVDQYFIGKAEKERELYREEAYILSTTLDAEFSIITGDVSEWEQIHMAEYYPTSFTYIVLDNIQKVLNEIPDYWYPKEAIEREDWNEVVAYYEEHRVDMIDYDRDLYEYIVSNNLPSSLSLEELLEKVKNEQGYPN